MLSDLEGWCELDWAGLSEVQIRLPPVREKLRDMSHCLSDCWTTLDNTQRLLSTLTEVKQHWKPSITHTGHYENTLMVKNLLKSKQLSNFLSCLMCRPPSGATQSPPPPPLFPPALLPPCLPSHHPVSKMPVP